MSADRELYGIVREIELVEEDIRDRNTAKSDIYKEAAAKGYDKKTIRKVVAARRQDPLEREEQDNQFDLYMQAIERAEKGLPHARVENIEEFGGERRERTSRDTGECPEAPPMDGSREGPSGTAATNSPETATMSLGDGDGGLSPSNGAATSGTGVTAGETADDGRDVEASGGAASVITNSPDGQRDEPAATTETVGEYLREQTAVVSVQIIREGDAPRETGRFGGVASSPDTDFQPPAFLARQKTMADYRPHCQHPVACASSTLDHCYGCRKALEAADHEVAA